MTKRIPQPRAELPPSIRQEEARLLAVMLRTSRLTWVFAEAGTDKSRLLTTGLMPLLQRRQSDLNRDAGPSEAPSVHRRRACDRAAHPMREAAIYFDRWSDTPLADLRMQIAGLLPPSGRVPPLGDGWRLARMLQHLNEHFGVHLILLFDRFEEYLSRPADQDEYARFSGELIEAFTLASLPASFLISLDEHARPMLERLRSRVPGLDHSFLRLTPIAPVGADGPQTGGGAGSAAVGGSRPSFTGPSARSVGVGSEPRRRGPPPRAPIRTEDVYALIEATLTRIAAPAEEAPTTARADGCHRNRT